MPQDLQRKTIVEGLLKVEKSGFSNLVLSSMLSDLRLTRQDKDFITTVFYGTLERKITLNAILQNFISKPLTKLDKEIVAIMQSGLYQILYMDSVPRYAAINQAVGLCSSFKKTSAKGLVNAVLRKAEKFDINSLKFKSEADRLSTLYSVSKEIVDIILRDYPERREEILKGLFTRPLLTVNINTNKISLSDYEKLLEKNGISYREMPARHSLEIQSGGSITNLPGFAEGYFFVQGVTSTFAGQSAKIKHGDSVLDLCAAPGGKTFAAAVELGGTGSILSCDPNESRLKLIRDGAERLGFSNITTRQNLGQIYSEKFVGKDTVICDVPCSGIGIIPKKPDLRYKNLYDIDGLVRLQYDILCTAAKYVKTGGRIVYSTCTVNKDENERQIAKFLSSHDNFAIVRQTDIPDGAIINGETVTFLPSHPVCDGFFIAVLEKMW